MQNKLRNLKMIIIGSFKYDEAETTKMETLKKQLGKGGIYKVADVISEQKSETCHVIQDIDTTLKFARSACINENSVPHWET